MNDKLIRQLQEEELFPNATPEDIKDREKNRPPRVLEGQELLDLLRDILCTEISTDINQSDINDHIMNGTPLVTEPIGEMPLKRVVRELRSSLYLNGCTEEEAFLELVKEHFGDQYDKINWV